MTLAPNPFAAPQQAFPAPVAERRMFALYAALGMAVLGVALGIALTTLLPALSPPGPPPTPQQAFQLYIFGVGVFVPLFGVLFALLGAAIGYLIAALRLPGPHRRSVRLAAFQGLIAGLIFATLLYTSGSTGLVLPVVVVIFMPLLTSVGSLWSPEGISALARADRAAFNARETPPEHVAPAP
jgi:hypothetical protein